MSTVAQVNSIVKSVDDWHRAKKLPSDAPVDNLKRPLWLETVRSAVMYMRDAATACERHHKFQSNTDKGVTDLRPLRLALLLEECMETVVAMSEGDEPELLDGLADLMWVVAGTAAVFDLPLGEAFGEITRSNYSKAASKPGNDRLRDKGSSYQPPNMKELIRCHRENKQVASVPDVVNLPADG